MFYGCNSFPNIDLSKINMQNVSDMSNMFNGCYILKNINLSNINAQNVSNNKNLDMMPINTIKYKNSKNEEEDEILEKLRQIQELRKGPITPEEEIVKYLSNMIMLFSLEEPNKRDLAQAKKNVDFYKGINKIMGEAIGKPLPEVKNRHDMVKSVTVGNITK